MSAKAAVLDRAVSRRNAIADQTPCPAWQVELVASLRQWFGIEFELFDAQSGQQIHAAADRPGAWMRGQLSRAAALHAGAQFIDDDDPLVVLAIPVQHGDERVVAVGTFVTRHPAAGEALQRAAEKLGLSVDQAASWISQQTVWNQEALLNVGQLASERISIAERLETLEREIGNVSLHLATSYEEISLMYRLTQNLKLSSKAEDLGELALEWLADALPAESLAMQVFHGGRTKNGARESHAEPPLLTSGPCPIDSEDLARMVEQFDLRPGGRPLVINRQQSSAESWAWPAVRELVIAPLTESANCFGWLVAINHSQNGSFGSVETGLLSSVAAILGIHSGNAKLYQQQRESFAGFVRALTSAIDAKDPYTCGHSDRVARVSVRLAEQLRCDRKQIDTIYLAGLLHDVGKIGIDDHVLRKPGKLTEAEYEHIKTHTEIGYKILVGIKQLEDVLPIVLHHHEQWDGHGYPRGLAGDDIPFLARIVAVADAFDAMGGDRTYRRGMSDEKLDAIMRDQAGKQWDASVVAAFFETRDEIREIAQSPIKTVGLDVDRWS